MSASPAGQTPSRTPNGASSSQPSRRKVAAPKPTNPLVTRKPKPRPAGKAPFARAPGAGFAPISNKPGAPSAVDALDRKKEALENRPLGDTTPSLFAQPPPQGTYTDYPIVISKKAMMAGLRYHVARFVAKKPVDVTDQEQFTRPLYLLRRDARAPLPGTKEWQEMQEMQRVKAEGTNEDSERNAERAAALAEIAPSQGKKKSTAKPLKKTQQVFIKDQTEEQSNKSQLKYEEALPWHFEDDEHKQIWMGTYEEATSNTWAQLKLEETPQGPRYIITPLQKWYKFLPKMRVDQDMIREEQEKRERYEARMKRGDSEEAFFMRAFLDADRVKAEEDEDNKLAGSRLFTGAGRGDDMRIKREIDEELDFEEDWADDEAPPAIEGEEADVKEIEQRIKKDNLKSNVFAVRQEVDYDEEAERERKENLALQKLGRKTAKALYKREHNAIYESDQENPYVSESESTDTEAEAEREREKKEAEAKAAATTVSGKPAGGSGSNSRNNTPGNRASKHPEPLSKPGSLKRPGSPTLSEASGNESSAARKKHKKNKLPGSKLASNAPSRPHSPAPSANGAAARPPPTTKTSFAGSGSDSEGAGAPRRLKLSPPRSPEGTPGGSRIASRAGSPAAGSAPAAGASSGTATPAAGAGPPKRTTLPTVEELKAMIPAGGMPMTDLVKQYTLTLGQRAKLVEMIKSIALYDKKTKTLTLKEA